MPLISVYIPCKNRHDLLRRCLEGFKAQTFADFEVVVADDQSRPSLAGLVESFGYRWVLAPGTGIGAAFNAALGATKGDYLVPFGSDDVPYPNLLERLWAAKDPKVDVVYPDYDVRDGQGFYPVVNEEFTDYQQLLKKQTISHGGSMWVAQSHPPYDESLESAVDWELILTAAEMGATFKHLPERLYCVYQGHPQETKTERQKESIRRILERRNVTV